MKPEVGARRQVNCPFVERLQELQGGWSRADRWGDSAARKVKERQRVKGGHVVKSQRIHRNQVAGRVVVRGQTTHPGSNIGPGNQQALILWAFPPS